MGRRERVRRVGPPMKVASGIYLAVVELKDASGNKVARQALKLMVTH